MFYKPLVTLSLALVVIQVVKAEVEKEPLILLKGILTQSSMYPPKDKVLSVNAGYDNLSVSPFEANAKLHESCNNVSWLCENSDLSRSLLSMDNLVAPWRGGPRPEVKLRKAIYFDGTSVQTIVQQYGKSGRLLYGATCNITSPSTGKIEDFDALATGRAFTLDYLLNANIGKFSSYWSHLQSITSENVGEGRQKFILTADSSAEVGKMNKTLEVTIEDTPVPHLVNLTEREIFTSSQGRETVTEYSYSVEKYTTLDKLIYPTEASYVSKKDGVELCHFTWKASEVKIQDSFPQFLPLPPVTTVIDDRTGLRFKTGNAPSKIVDHVRELRGASN